MQLKQKRKRTLYFFSKHIDIVKNANYHRRFCVKGYTNRKHLNSQKWKKENIIR